MRRGVIEKIYAPDSAQGSSDGGAVGVHLGGKRSVGVGRAQRADGADGVFQRGLDLLHRSAVAAEKVRLEDDVQDGADLSLGIAVLPGQHALMDQVRFRRQVAGSVVV